VATAEDDIQTRPVPQSILPAFEQSFRLNPVDKRRDVSDGSIRYRCFGDWVVTFQFGISDGAHHLSILRIEPYDGVSANPDVLKRLWEVIKIFSRTARAADAAAKRKT
jgi:hypothetical protein